MTARARTSRASKILGLIALTTLPLVSCDTSTIVIGAEVSGYIARVTVNGIRAELVQAARPPAGNGPTVTAPPSADVITGGSWQSTLVGSGPFQSVAVFVDGVDGYYLANLLSPVTTAEVVITFGAAPPDLDFDVGYAVAGADGVWGPYATTSIAAIQVAGGDIQVSVTWNTVADVDLHVIDPFGNEVYFGNRESPQGGQLDIDANAACSTSPFYQENIGWLPGSAPSGEYTVRLEYWSECGVSQTDYVVTVSVRPGQPGGSVLTYSGSFTGLGTGGGAGSGIPITTFRF